MYLYEEFEQHGDLWNNRNWEFNLAGASIW